MEKPLAETSVLESIINEQHQLVLTPTLSDQLLALPPRFHARDHLSLALLPENGIESVWTAHTVEEMVIKRQSLVSPWTLVGHRTCRRACTAGVIRDLFHERGFPSTRESAEHDQHCVLHSGVCGGSVECK